MGRLQPLQSGTRPASVKAGKVMVIGATIVTSPLAASNGADHNIHTVLLPPAG